MTEFPLSMTQAAAALGCSSVHLYRKMRAGTAPRTVKHGKHRLILPDDMRAYLASLPCD